MSAVLGSPMANSLPGFAAPTGSITLATSDGGEVQVGRVWVCDPDRGRRRIAAPIHRSPFIDWSQSLYCYIWPSEPRKEHICGVETSAEMRPPPRRGLSP